MFNKLIVACLPLVPRPIIRKISSRYIAGDFLADAMTTARRLHADEGARSTVDVLGEFVDSRERALTEKAASFAVLDAIAADELRDVSGLSVKPTSLGLGLDVEFAYANILELATRARDLGIFMRAALPMSNAFLPAGTITTCVSLPMPRPPIKVSSLSTGASWPGTFCLSSARHPSLR